MILADKLIKLRKKAGLSQEELADKMDVSRQSVSKWESAQCAPELSKLIQLSNFYGVSLDYLLKDEVTEETPVEITGQEAHDAAFASDRRRYVLYSIFRRAFTCLLFLITALVIIAVKRLGDNTLMDIDSFMEQWIKVNGYVYNSPEEWQKLFDAYLDTAKGQMFYENLKTIALSFIALTIVGAASLVYNFVRFYNFTGFIRKSENTMLEDKSTYSYLLKIASVASAVFCVAAVAVPAIGVSPQVIGDWFTVAGIVAAFASAVIYIGVKSFAGAYAYGADTLKKTKYICCELTADSACIYWGAVSLAYLIWCAVDMFSAYSCLLWAGASAVFFAAYVLPEFVRIFFAGKNTVANL